ncbi:MAG: arabinofuranan 3-O-arabinosyltransferase [Micromonosporaceae bacterium]
MVARVRGWVTPSRRATTLALVGLAVLSFGQRPGQVTFDTKLDLAVNPLGFLTRALHLWNPQATSGELQDQAYGYLFPMGPFFALGQVLGMPTWVAQRLWCTVLLGGGYLGLLLVARAMGIGTEPTRQVGALAYALAPRMLTEVGSLSAEMLPAVLLPWVLLPLMKVDRIGSPRRAAALSALAVLGMGGVNGSMVLMVLVLPGLWLLTRRFTADHVRLVAWWCAAVGLCVLWWFLPLLLLGRYSLPFLNYIESSTNTTAVVSLFQALRGTNQWVAYIVQGEPWWPSGWVLVDNPVLMIATMLVAAVGLAGLTRRGLPERRFLVLGLLAGLVLLTVGYVGSLDSPLATVVRHLLDGPLAAFRNVHKFEPVLRVPLALGFAHGAAVLSLKGRAWRRAVPALALVLVAAAPAWLFVLRAGPGWSGIPGYWQQAATWLGEQDPAARTLMVPATGFGDYTWGHTVDEPLQGLAQAPWAVRNQVPLGSEGNTRVMDAVEQVLDSGRGSAGLAGFLARSGYTFVLLRNDIDRVRTDAPPVAVLRQALRGSPGIARAVAFGPEVVPVPATASPVDVGAQPPPALEIYRVQRAVPRVTAVDTSDVATVSGGPESLLPLLGQGLLESGRPTVLAGDLTAQSTGERAAGAGPWLVTDGLRRRERNPGRVRDNVSQTLTAGEAPRQARSALDILPFPAADHQTVAVLQGIQSVTASTSASYADAYGSSEPSYQPFAAIDGDRNTAWRSSSLFGPVGQWLEVRLDTPRRIDQVDLEFAHDLRVGWPVTRFRITTDTGSTEQDVDNDTGSHRYPVPPGLTATVRVTVLAVAGARTTGNVGIRELRVPGTAASRALRVPADLSAGPGRVPAFSFSRGDDARSSCVAVGGVTRCDPLLGRTGEEPEGIDRLFRTPSAAHYSLALTALPRLGGPVPLLGQAVTATASSWLDGDPAVAGYAAIDGDPATSWLADISDLRPTLTLRWSGARRIGEIRLRSAGSPAASTPTILEVRSPDQTRLIRLDARGAARFAPLVTDQITIVVRDSDTRVMDRRRGGAPAPAGIAELEVPALADLMPPIPPSTRVGVPCGQGPVVQIDGTGYPTAVGGTLADLVAQRPLPVTICDPFLVDGADLAAGEHELRTLPSVPFAVQSAVLAPGKAGKAAATATSAVHDREVTVARWAATERSVHIGAGNEALLVVPENANAGWVATLNGRTLAPSRVDGWQQAWVVPAGSGGTVVLRFAPDRTYRDALAAGGTGVLALAAMILLPGRRRPLAAPVPSRSRLVPAVLLALLVVLGGVLPVVFVLAAMLVRQVWRGPRGANGRPGSLAVLALSAAGAATAVAVTGRLLGHGQGWAYGPLTQGAMLAAVATVVAACLRAPRGGPLDEAATGDEQPGAAAGGTGDLGDPVVQPAAHEHDLDPDRDPHRHGRHAVPAGDAGEQQQLSHREQHPGEREQPYRLGPHAVAGTADQPQQVAAGQADQDDGRVQRDHDEQRGAHDPAAMSRVGEAGQRDHPDGLR